MLREPMGNGPLARALGAVYFAAAGCRNAFYTHLPQLSADAGLPVVSVGGIQAGGTGKTPLCLLIGAAFAGKGITVVFASRGYGRRSRRPLVVRPDEEAAWEQVGDEPAMLRANLAQAWLVVGPDRLRGLRGVCAELRRPAVAILDDGFQHRRVRRCLDIVCVTPDPWRDLPLPAGYLREPLSSLRRADVVCVNAAAGEEPAARAAAERLKQELGHERVYALVQTPGTWVNLASGACAHLPPTKKPALLSAIARPQRFERLVKALGFEPYCHTALPDHHPFTEAEVRLAAAGGSDALLTTEKDAMRLLKLKLENEVTIWYLKVRTAFTTSQDEQHFAATLYSRTLCEEAPR
jgi:tetraacyldisaccharide 4'-kinase